MAQMASLMVQALATLPEWSSWDHGSARARTSPLAVRASMILCALRRISAMVWVTPTMSCLPRSSDTDTCVRCVTLRMMIVIQA